MTAVLSSLFSQVDPANVGILIMLAEMRLRLRNSLIPRIKRLETVVMNEETDA